MKMSNVTFPQDMMFKLTKCPEDKDVNFAFMCNKSFDFKSWDKKMLLLLHVCCKMSNQLNIQLNFFKTLT